MYVAMYDFECVHICIYYYVATFEVLYTAEQSIIVNMPQLASYTENPFKRLVIAFGLHA